MTIAHEIWRAEPRATGLVLYYSYMYCRSTIEQKNSTSLPTDNAKAQDTGQQNNQGKESRLKGKIPYTWNHDIPNVVETIAHLI